MLESASLWVWVGDSSYLGFVTVPVREVLAGCSFPSCLSRSFLPVLNPGHSGVSLSVLEA